MLVEVGHFGDVRDGEVTQEEGALPVEVTGIGSLGTVLQGFVSKFLEPQLHAFLVVCLSQPLHFIHHFGRYPMV